MARDVENHGTHGEGEKTWPSRGGWEHVFPTPTGDVHYAAATHRPHEARDVEAEPETTRRVQWKEDADGWTKHSAVKTAHSSKTGGWGFPW